MKDFFELLGQPRRPWLDAETIQQAFVSAAAGVHPDRIHDAPANTRQEAQDRYTALNEAQLCLRSARCRLRHLLELEEGSPVGELQEVPDDLMETFSQLSRQIRTTDAHLKKCREIVSPLLKVALFKQGEELRQELQRSQAALQERRETLDSQLHAVSEQWEIRQANESATRRRLLTEMETLYRFLSFNDRWQDQIASRLTDLMSQA